MIPIIIGFSIESLAQNVTPVPTKLSIDYADDPHAEPTPIRRLKMESVQIFGAHVEAMTENRIILSKVTIDPDENKRFYVWDLNANELWDTKEDGLANSVVASKDGRFMIFLHDEFRSRRDVNGDGQSQTVLRFYHFDTAQKINLGIPARSATPKPGETRSTFEYFLDGNMLTYSVSQSFTNTNLDRDAPWNIVDLKKILYAIEGTPTPTPTPTPLEIPTSTPTPSPTLAPVSEALQALFDDFEIQLLNVLNEPIKSFGNNIVIGQNNGALIVSDKPQENDKIVWYRFSEPVEIIQAAKGISIQGIVAAGRNAFAVLVENKTKSQWELYKVDGPFDPLSVKDFLQY